MHGITDSILITTPMHSSYQWNQYVGEKNGYLLTRDGLDEYLAEHPGDYRTFYTNIPSNITWLKLIRALEQTEVKNVREYENCSKCLMVFSVHTSVYTPPMFYQRTDRFTRKLVILTPHEYEAYGFDPRLVKVNTTAGIKST
ncbi:MAG: hypothetical protein V1703_00405 [Candidatus Altiarchaeota archaeon]